MTNKAFMALLTGTSVTTFASVFLATGSPAVHATVSAAAGPAVFYPGCDAVRTLGKAPLHRGEPGYRSEMDGDGDGVACEPRAAGDKGGRGGSFRRRRR